MANNYNLCVLVLIEMMVLCYAGWGQKNYLIATLSRNNIVGSVIFENVGYSYNTKISFDLNGNLRSFKGITAQITSNLVVYENACTDIGKPILTIQKNIHPNSMVISSRISVSGERSIFGRTLVLLENNTPIACASILPAWSITYAKVSISNNKIAGSFEFIQSKSTWETVITGEISASDGSVQKPNIELDWFVSSKGDCTSDYNDEDRYTYYGQYVYNQISTLVHLTRRHGPVKVGIAGSERIQVIDGHINVGRIVGRTLVLKNRKTGEQLGCGVFNLAGPLSATASFVPNRNKGINGRVSFKQKSPYHPTLLSVHLRGLMNRTAGYHVHQYPIAQIEDKCSPASVGGHFNPFNIIHSQSPKPGQGSLEMYEIGDLSGKFGSLAGKNFIYNKWVDTNLPLYGKNTIIGRSVVIHRNHASRLTCSNIKPKYARELTGLVDFTANKASVLKGSITMTQFLQPNGVLTPTTMVVDLKYRNDETKKTLNHNWHVHIKPLGDDKGKICSSVLGHYNPTNVSVAKPAYPAQCSRDLPYRCELGDTSSKVGTYDVGSGKRLYADSDTPLLGKFTSLGRSIVIHVPNKGAGRLACANIIGDHSESFW